MHCFQYYGSFLGETQFSQIAGAIGMQNFLSKFKVWVENSLLKPKKTLPSLNTNRNTIEKLNLSDNFHKKIIHPKPNIVPISQIPIISLNHPELIIPNIMAPEKEENPIARTNQAKKIPVPKVADPLKRIRFAKKIPVPIDFGKYNNRVSA